VTVRLLLVGGGHAHLSVLDLIAHRRLKGIEVTLISANPYTLYSGMAPGLIAGLYREEQCLIPLDTVCDKAHATFSRANVQVLDLDQKMAFTDQGKLVPFDVVSVNIGAAPDLHSITGLENSVPLRPLEQLIHTWSRIESRYAGTPLSQTVGVIGGGPAGVEVAAALARRARDRELQLKMTIVTGKAGLLPSFPRAAAKMMQKRLTALNVRVLEADAESIGVNSVRIPAVGEYYADLTISALPAAAWRWPVDSGLAVDRRGFIEVNSQLQSISHPFVFGAGDCVSMRGRKLPRSGVYALKAGRVLGENLLRALTQRPLQRYRPQTTSLALISAGEPYAVGIYGSFVFEGDWVWRWKDRIDRRFAVRHHARP
jgi:pyridine nucleotide-disulfide oxidoreductase family protein